MHRLSPEAGFILARMQPDRPYDVTELRAIVPDISVERLRDLMHELWVNRRVERVGYLGWRRHWPTATAAPPSSRGAAQSVKPEDLFDHAAFEDFFK